MWLLQRSLSEICGLPHVSLQPSAGAHGELAGLLLTRAYHADRGEQRTKVLTPDTAHGTNPATVTMAGYEVVKVATDERGGIDVDDLRAKADDDVACLMLDQPEHARPVRREHRRRSPRSCTTPAATLYYDGANLNAVMGISRPGDMGFDIVHVNLHKSFSPAARRRRPGRRADRGLATGSSPSCRAPQVVRARGPATAASPASTSTSTGRSRSAGCAASRATSASSCAPTPTSSASAATACSEASETAVLNANYLLARLREGRAGKYLPVAFDRTCMHEFVLSGAPAKRELGVKTLDIAKRLLDFGFHPPTVYFPLLVDEALMVEPTETETKETLDAFAEAIEEILAEAEEDPEIARNAPYTTPVRRLDEVGGQAQAGRAPAALAARRRRRRSPSSRRRQLLLELEHRREQVAVLLDPLQQVGDLEAELVGLAALRGALDLAPSERGRGRGALAGAQRVDGDRRLVLVVLAPVDEDLALARSFLAIFETTSSGSASRAAGATALANGLVCS